VSPLPSRPRPRALLPLTAGLVLAAAAAAVVAACGMDDSVTPEALDGGGEGGAAPDGGCPTTRPTTGTACTLPEGTTCDFGLCGTRLAQCSRGTWVVATNDPPRPPCPEIAPNIDTPCPACWSADVTCNYGSDDCSLPDASDNTTLASCPDGGWVVEFRPCRDAGPDVQGDGGPDAD
jgi:hypothetical protein